MLEISGVGIPLKYVCLPPSVRLKILIKPASRPNQLMHPIDVIVSSSKWLSEAILSLITSGDMEQAKSLSNAREAEMLLYKKIEDPTGATVGGYFLLKINDLDRLHDWANNLSNWFEWMPDGSIIHAWQLINDRLNIQKNIPIIRKRLLEAVDRGIPIYTEGLRLLLEGLTMLSYHFFKQDRDIEMALRKIKNIAGEADWNCPTTTFTSSNSLSNDEPSNRIRTIVKRRALKELRRKEKW